MKNAWRNVAALAALGLGMGLVLHASPARACTPDSPVACSDGQGADWCCICACGATTYGCDDTSCQPACNSGLLCQGACCDYGSVCCDDGTCPGPDGCAPSCPFTLCLDGTCPPAEGQCGDGNACVTDCGDGTCCTDPSAPICCPDGQSCGADDYACASGGTPDRSSNDPGSSDTSTGSSALPTEYRWQEDPPDCSVGDAAARGIGTSSGRHGAPFALGALAALAVAMRRTSRRRRARPW